MIASRADNLEQLYGGHGPSWANAKSHTWHGKRPDDPLEFKLIDNIAQISPFKLKKNGH
jgi:hypothetical protein